MSKSGVVGNLVVRVGADLSGFSTGMKKLQKDLTTLSNKTGKMGSALTKGITVPVAAAATGLAALTVHAGQAADEVITLSNQTGISTQTLQGMGYASRFVDVSVEDMAKGLAKTTKEIGEATASGNDFIELADGIKVGIKGANGQLKDSEQVFYDVIDALGSMTDETQREIAAQEIFGRSYQDIMPLIRAGSGALKDYTEEAKKMGIVMSDEQVAKLGEFDDSMQRLQGSFEAAGNKIAIALIPMIKEMIPVIEEKVVPAVIDFAEGIGDLIKWFANLDPFAQKAIIGFVGVGTALGPALTGLSGILSIGAGVAKSLSGIGIAAGAAGSGGVATFSGALMGLIGPAGTLALVALGCWAVVEAIKGISAGIEDVKAGATTKDIVKKQSIQDQVQYSGYTNSMISAEEKAAKEAAIKAAAQAGSRYSAIPKLAEGGVVTRPTLALIGEAGPEEVRPLKDKGGININIYGNISGEREATRVGNQIVRQLKLSGVNV